MPELVQAETPVSAVRQRSRGVRYGAAVALTGAALAISLAAGSLVSSTIFIFFFAAVVLSAWYGGRGPALLAAALAIPVADAFLLRPVMTQGEAVATVIRFVLFAAISVLIGSMRESLDRSLRGAEQREREAVEQRVMMEEQAAMLQEQAAEMEEQQAELELQSAEARALALELEEANERLQESTERQLAEAQAMAHVGSWEWDVAEGRVRWSDEMFRIYGYQPGQVQVTLDSFLDHVHPGDREQMRGVVAQAVETREPFEADHRIVRADGAERVLHARGRVELDGRGRVARMVGTGQDVTADRDAARTARSLAAEQAARQAADTGRRRLEAVLEGIAEAFVAVDGEWRYTYVNRNTETLLGRSRAEMLGRPMWEAFPGLAGQPIEAELRAVRDRGAAASFEHYSPRLGRWLAVHAAPWEDGLSVFFEDVTERRRAQEQVARLAAIVEGSTDAIFAKALDGTLLSWNRGAGQLYGYTPEEMVGQNVAVLAPADRHDEIPAILERISRGESIASFETVRRRKDGALVDVLLAISPIHGPDGRVVAASTIARDITGRKRTEARLRESEARYRRLIDTANEGVWLLSPDGRTQYANERMAALLGLAPADMVDRAFVDFVHPQSRAEAAEQLARRGDGAPEQHDVRFVRADGGDLWALVSLSAVADDEGRWTGALAMVTDVTDRRRAEERVEFLADASRVLAASLDFQTTVQATARLVVPRLADYCVVMLNGTDGRPGPSGLAHADPARVPALRRLVALRRERPEPDGPTATVLASGQPLLVEDMTPPVVQAMVQDAESRALLAELAPRSVMLVPLRLDDRVLGAVAIATAQSERRFSAADLELAEELAHRAATAVENARLHAAEQQARRDAEGAVHRTARLQAVTAALSEARTPLEVARATLRESAGALGAAAGWFGQLSADGTAVELVHEQGFPAAVVERFRRVPLSERVALSDTVRTGQVFCAGSPAEMEQAYPAVSDVGQRSAYQAWAVAPLWIEGRPVGGMVLNFVEPREFDGETREFLMSVGRQAALALERARLYEAEREARAEAEAANRAKFEFLTTMSHELRTPLNAIAGYVELLELGIRGPINPEQRKDLERIRRSQTHLLGLINDVLNFARIETGHVHFELRSVPVDELLGEVEALIAPQVQAKGLEYEYRAVDAEVVARADAEKLRQIILNLLSNAVKFTAPGGRIRLEGEADGDDVRIRVHDTGMGIPEDKLATIFEPFVQVATGYTRTSEGTGLGLSISRDLARAMGGELSAESREGEGSVFTLVLPRAEPADDSS